jgi:hypothetical protein
VGSGFGRVSAYGFHGWNTERSYTSLSAYVENTTYLRRYGNRQLFSLNAATSLKASETVNLSGGVGFSGDFGAQLGSRFYSVPQTLATEARIVVEQPLVLVTPDLAAINQRQYRLSGNLGASFVLSPRDSVTTSLGAQRVFAGGNANGLDYNQLDGSAGYSRQVNERWSFGAQAVASYADYSIGRSILLYGPQLTAAAQLNENVDFRGSIGFLRSEQDGGALGGRAARPTLLSAVRCAATSSLNACAFRRAVRRRAVSLVPRRFRRLWVRAITASSMPVTRSRRRWVLPRPVGCRSSALVASPSTRPLLRSTARSAIVCRRA